MRNQCSTPTRHPCPAPHPPPATRHPPPMPAAGEYDDESQRRNSAKHSLERYMHYFERFDAHNKARQKVGSRARTWRRSGPPPQPPRWPACSGLLSPRPPRAPPPPPPPHHPHHPPPHPVQAKEDAEAARGTTVERLSDITKTPTSQLKYVMDAWGQVRRGGGRGGWGYARATASAAQRRFICRQRHQAGHHQGTAPGPATSTCPVRVVWWGAGWMGGRGGL
jgi:hypothetical protein